MGNNKLGREAVAELKRLPAIFGHGFLTEASCHWGTWGMSPPR